MPSTVHLLNIEPAQRRYRVVCDIDNGRERVRLVRSCPNSLGSRSIATAVHDSRSSGLAGCQKALLRDFSDDFPSVYATFMSAFRIWSDGVKDVRPQARAFLKRAEVALNDLRVLIVGYAQAYQDLLGCAAAEGVQLPEQTLPEWIESGLRALADGTSGQWWTLNRILKIRSSVNA